MVSSLEDVEMSGCETSLFEDDNMYSFPGNIFIVCFAIFACLSKALYLSVLIIFSVNLLTRNHTNFLFNKMSCFAFCKAEFSLRKCIFKGFSYFSLRTQSDSNYRRNRS